MLADHLLKINKEKKFKKAGDSRYIYQNELDKACFQHDMAYGNFKDLPRETASDKVLHHKAFNIAKNQKYNGYQVDLASMVYHFMIKDLLVLILQVYHHAKPTISRGMTQTNY